MKKITGLLAILLMWEAGVYPVVALGDIDGMGEENLFQDVFQGINTLSEMQNMELSDGDSGKIILHNAYDEFYFTVLNPKPGGTSYFKVVSPERHNMNLVKVRVATYDYAKWTSEEVDERVDELTEEGTPAWVDQIQQLNFNVKYSTEWTRQMWFDSASKKFLRNGPGIIYYAVLVQDLDEGTEKWLTGKVNYHDAAYSVANNPHVSLTCNGTMSADGRYELSRTVPLDGEIEDWEVEFGKILDEKLGGLEEEVEAWNGDVVAKESLVGRIKDVKHVAVDTDKTNGQQDWADRLLAKLATKEQEIIKAEEEKRKEEELKQKEEEEKKRQEEEEERRRQEEEERKRQEEEEKKKQEELAAQQRPSGTSGMNGSASGNGSIGGGAVDDIADVSGGRDEQAVGAAIIIANADKNKDETVSNINTVQTAEASMTSSVATSEGLEGSESDENDKNDENGEDGAETDMKDDAVEVPVLNKASTENDGREVAKESNGIWWLAILVILGIATLICGARKVWREYK